MRRITLIVLSIVLSIVLTKAQSSFNGLMNGAPLFMQAGPEDPNYLIQSTGWNTGMIYKHYTSHQFYVNGNVEAMRIAQNGDVGIGIDAPSARLHVKSPFGYNASGTVVKLGGKDSWNTNDFERFQLGFSQLQSIYNGSAWDFSVNTGSANGIGVEALRVKSNGDIWFNNPNTPFIFSMNRPAGYGLSSGVWAYTQTASNLSLFADAAVGSAGVGVNIVAYNGTYHSGLRYANTGVGGAIPTLVLQESGGTIGVGTTCIPSGYKLAVKGKIICEGVKVKLENGNCWADYVFSENYKLLPIEALSQYISENNHLPNIPSANEVEEGGLDLAEMQVKQMEKIEELTLYLIHLKEENDALKKRVESLESQVKK